LEDRGLHAEILTEFIVDRVAGVLVLTEHENVIDINGEENLTLSGEVDAAIRGA
jgi:hypothetical protein